MMKKHTLKKVLSLLCISMALSFSAEAQTQHGISRYNELKYPANFTAFDYVKPDAPKGGELRVAVMGSYDTLNQTIKGNAVEGLPHMYESLLARAADEPFTLYGLVAESVEVGPNNQWVIFMLRPEAKWQDGTPITPEDVIFSWEIQRDKGLPMHRTHYSKVEKAEKVGDRGVKFTFKKEADGTVDPERPMIMGMMRLHPKKYWQGKEFDAVTLTPPLASGPYRIKEFEPGRFIVYERIPNYWGENLPVRKGQNNFDIIRYDYYRNANVALEAFKSGAFDVIHETDLNRWNTAYKGPAFKKGSIKKAELPHIRPVGIKGFVFNTRRDIFKDIRVRQALSLLFDFEWMNKNLFDKGYKRTESYFENSPLKAQGKPTGKEKELLLIFKDKLDPSIIEEEVPVPSQTDGSGRDRKIIAKALALLKEAGWEMKKGKLVNVKTGKPFIFEILISQPEFEKTALAYARSLKNIGIEAKVRMIDTAQYEERRLNWDYDMIPNWWASTLTPGNEQYLYWTKKAAKEPGCRNYMGIEDDVVDALVDKLAKATTAQEVEYTAKALDRVMRWGYYLVPLYFADKDRFAYWDKFGMPAWRPEVGPNTMTWWILPEKDKKK